MNKLTYFETLSATITDKDFSRSWFLVVINLFNFVMTSRGDDKVKILFEYLKTGTIPTNYVINFSDISEYFNSSGFENLILYALLIDQNFDIKKQNVADIQSMLFYIWKMSNYLAEEVLKTFDYDSIISLSNYLKEDILYVKNESLVLSDAYNDFVILIFKLARLI